jgi:acetyl-CoA C-acetyltransferase
MNGSIAGYPYYRICRNWPGAILRNASGGDGPQPVNPDGGLKSFGHPIGASGLRMMYEMWVQLRGEAGDRQIENPKVGLTHNLGGFPGKCVSFVSLVGK